MKKFSLFSSSLVVVGVRGLRSTPLQVVVDIDDTIKSSGNVRLGEIALGGIDGQYPRGCLYPGVFDFVRELAQSHGGEAEPAAVLTARAREFKFALELDDDDQVVRGFRKCARRNSMQDWGIDYSRVMYGSAHEWIFQDFKAWRKFSNFQLLAQSLGDLSSLESSEDAEMQASHRSQSSREYVFIGDTGEMDRLAGEMMLSRHPELIQYVFLHCVSESSDGSDVFVPVDYAVGNKGRVLHFRTYVGAAYKAVKAGLIDQQAFDRIASASLADLDAMSISANNDPRNQLHDVLTDLRHARAARQDVTRQESTKDLILPFHQSNTTAQTQISAMPVIKEPIKVRKPWWERPLVSKFLSVDSNHHKHHHHRKGFWRRPFRFWRQFRRRRRLRKHARKIESALSSAEL